MALTRAKKAMPEDVRDALAARKLTKAYEARPAYQRNDYLLWIGQAKREETKKKRLDVMLDELKRGDVYMNMAWKGEGKPGRPSALANRSAPGQ